MPKGYSTFRACIFCDKPFRPESRIPRRENFVCDNPNCQAKLMLYKRLAKSRTALLAFIKNLELKK